MRKLKQLRLLVLLLIASMAFTGHADPKREFRSGWFTCVSNMDWPTTKGTSATEIAAQKAEMIAILDAMQEAHLNSASFHALPMSDAFYPSRYLPWSQWLTGTRGTAPSDPTWNPLQFFIDECHKRGMQALAWLNPYRYSGNASATYVWHTTNAGWNNSLDREMQQHIINHNYYYTLNPGDPWSLKHLKDIVTELAGYKDLDGIIFDDYFYPNLIPENNTATDWSTYQSYKNKGGTLSIGDWRRSNVNTMVRELYSTIKSIDPNMTFGISPAGIAGSAATSGNKYTSDGVSANPCKNDWQYNQIYSDPLAWLKDRSIDYISPQLYWATTNSTNAYGTQIDWWSNVANIFGRHCYASHYIASGESQASTSNIIKWENPSTFSELKSEVDLNRSKTRNNAPGSILFSIKWLQTKTDMRNYIENNVFTRPSLRPVMTWMPKGNYSAPQNLSLEGSTLTWDEVTSDRGHQYAVYAIPTSVTLAKSKGTDGIKNDYLIGTPYNNEFELSSQYRRGGYWFAVTAIDAAGNEYEAAVMGEPDPSTEPDYEAKTVDIASQDKWKEGWKNTSFNSSNNARNLCYGDGKLYVATTDGNVHVLNPKTGATIKKLNNAGVSGGALALCGIQYVNGKIYAANVTIAPSSSAIKVYCWDNDDAAPRVVLNKTTTQLSRAGDHFAITGDPMTSGYFYFVFDTKAVRFKMTNGVYAESRDVTTLPNAVFGGSPHIEPVDDSSFWVNGKDHNPIRYNWVNDGTATVAEVTGSILGVTTGTAFTPFKLLGSDTEYAFVTEFTSNTSYSKGLANLIRKQNGAWNTGANVHVPQGGMSDAANGGSGSSVAVNLINAGDHTAAVEMWVLIANEGIAHYYTEANDVYATAPQGRSYRMPVIGDYAGQKLMELNGGYNIANAANTAYGLDCDGRGDSNGTNIQIWGTDRTVKHQQFQLISVGDGYYKIKANHCDRVLDVYDNTDAPYGEGSNVQLYDDNGASEQHWKLEKNNDGTYTIRNRRNSNLVLDMKGGGAPKDGTNIVLWTSNNTSAQKWELIPTAGRAVIDPYFVKHLIEKGYASIYNEDTHAIEGKATIASNFLNGDVYSAPGKHVVITPEVYNSITEFNGLGKYGDNSPTTGNYSKRFSGIADLKGIEYFTNLMKLDMSRHVPGDDSDNYGNQYTRLEDGNIDLQHNTKLEWLDLNYANLTDATKAGFSKLTNLKYLNLCNNNFSAFDMRPFDKLERLEMANNYSLTKIDAERNENLKELAIFDSMYGWNKDYTLQRLIDNFPYLVFLHAYATAATELDLSKHSLLQSVWLNKPASGNTSGTVTNGTYNIACYTDKTLGLDCYDNGTANGTNVQIYPLTSTDKNKQFVLTKQSGDYFQIKDVNSGKVLDVTGGANVAGTNVELYEWNGTDAQLWKFSKNSDGSYTISSKLKKSTEGDLVLAVNNSDFRPEANVNILGNTGTAAQKWVLLPIEISSDSRHLAKGPWLHKLDLSGCTDLRDLRVQNMHLASLNINSTTINQPIDSKYQTWQFCREVTDHDKFLEDKGKLAPAINVDNNYRYLQANIAKWVDSKGKKYWMYYLRTAYDGNNSDNEASKNISNKAGYYETLTYDNYATSKVSRKTVDITSTLSDDGFDITKMLSCKTASEVDDISSNGMISHTAAGGSDLCVVSDHDGTVEILNASALPGAFVNNISGKVNGTIIILAAGVGDNYPTTQPTGMPAAISYEYNLLYTQPAMSAGSRIALKDSNTLTGTFYFGIDYPSIFTTSSIVTGVDNLDASKEIVSVKYYDVAGRESVIPFRGINIVHVTYTDGTTTTAKVIK